MSYWAYLEHDGKSVDVPSHTEGGTYVLGGIGEAELNITYNYARHFNFRGLNGQVARDTIPLLFDAVTRLGMQRDPDYWKPTEGNVGYCLNILFRWAKANPDAVWRIS